MIFCEKCGTKNEGTNACCIACGESLGIERQQAAPIPVQQAAQIPMQQNYGMPIPQNQPSLNPVLYQIKAAAKSPLFLGAVAVYSVMVFLNLIQLFISSGSSYDSMPYYGFGIGSMFDSIGIVKGITTVIGFFGMIPTFLITAGLWVFYASANRLGQRPAGGLTLIKVSTILTLIGQLGIIVLGLIGSIIIVVASKGDLAGAMLLLFLVVCIIMILPILHSFSILSVLTSTKQTINYGQKKTNGMGLVVVLNYIMAGCSCIGLIFSVASASFAGSMLQNVFGGFPGEFGGVIMGAIYSWFAPSALEIICQIMTIAVFVVFGIVLSKYKKSMV